MSLGFVCGRSVMPNYRTCASFNQHAAEHRHSLKLLATVEGRELLLAVHTTAVALLQCVNVLSGSADSDALGTFTAANQNSYPFPLA